MVSWICRPNWSYYNHHHHCCCCSDFHFVPFVFFVVAVAGNPLPFLPWCWCQRSGPVFFLLGRTKTRFGVCCCCCCCTCIDIYRNRKSIFVVVGTGIDMFEIGLSLILCLRLHLLYYKVQQQIEMDEFVPNIHPVSRSNRSYYNHHHYCCCCSDFRFVPFGFFVVAVHGYCFTAL